MGETFTNEGMDLIMGVFPKNGTNLANTYVGLFTGPGTASSVTAMQAAVLATSTNITEASPGGYARQAMAASGWGAQAAGTGAAASGRQSTGAQLSFPAASGAYATAINGFFLANAVSAGISIFVANFDDVTAIASLALGDIVKITPVFGLLP